MEYLFSFALKLVLSVQNLDVLHILIRSIMHLVLSGSNTLGSEEDRSPDHLMKLVNRILG